MPCLTRILTLYGIVLGVVPSIHAQTPPPQVFEWYFAGTQTVSASLPSCRSFPLAADARTANGTPPFYMMAFDVGGSPLTSFIGTNQSNLTWTVAHPVGSQLVLGMVDALGQSGGISPTLYNVTAGATTQCVPPTVSEPTPFKISANVTDVLNTCQPWGLTIEGGTPPYNITLAELNLGNVTNVTLGPTDTVFTYINRMVPGGQVIGINGRWATGSPFVRTQGSTDIDCVGLVSSGSIGTSPSGSHTSHHKLSHAAKIGIIVGVLVAAVLLCAIIGFVVRRRRRRVMQSSPNSLPEAVAVTPFMRQNGRSLAGAHSNLNSGSTTAPTRTQSKRSTVTPDSTTMAETSSSSPSSPSPSSPRVVVVRELPPPYPNWLR
ncbi:hypothetical protein MSAN_00850600 [Mycena sanguinolenta]|uniref:Uncharacterized protein n=1 Tax=Mycena sanguinolenta TaxID=230812 RepID=A0A8H6YZZ8_9AGAR|nr:hypothetical protein MSAN_00850600 [Mycena sanguinolenta]